MREILFQVREGISTVGRGNFRALVEDERVKVPLQLYKIIAVRHRIEFVGGFMSYAFNHTKRLARELHWEEAEANEAIRSFSALLKDAFPRIRCTFVPLVGYPKGDPLVSNFGARIDKDALHVHQEILDACALIPWGRVKDAEAFLTFVQNHRGLLASKLGWPTAIMDSTVWELMKLLQWAFPKIPWTTCTFVAAPVAEQQAPQSADAAPEEIAS
jgi:hypothetical protein